MNIPNFFESQVVDKDGYLTEPWRQILMQLFSELQINMSNEGYKLPQVTSANITKLNNIKSKGAILYNSDTDKAMVNLAGTFKVIQTL